MTKPFNIHDWQAKQKQQRLDEQYYVTVNRGRGGGKRLVRSAESDYEEPRVFSNYGEAEKYIKQAKRGGATPGQITSYWVSDENMNRINQDSSFDDRLKAAGGFSDEEFNDITSKDIGSSFPGPSTDVGNGVIQAQELIKTLKNNYKNMSDRELDAFSVEMTKHFLDNLAARDEAKIYLAKNPSNKMGENTTGTGASFQAGAGEAYATPKAFGKNKDKNIEVLGYKKI
jgi:hypothetical protein